MRAAAWEEIAEVVQRRAPCGSVRAFCGGWLHTRTVSCVHTYRPWGEEIARDCTCILYANILTGCTMLACSKFKTKVQYVLFWCFMISRCMRAGRCACPPVAALRVAGASPAANSEVLRGQHGLQAVGHRRGGHGTCSSSTGVHGGPRCPAVFIDGRQVENLLEGHIGVNNLFTPPFNLHIALSLADTISKAPRVTSQCSSLHGERQNPHSTARRVTCWDQPRGPSDFR